MKARFLSVKENKGLVRDTNSNAILHVDDSEYEKYLEEKHKRGLKDRRLNTLENEVAEIKNMLSKILEKLCP